MKDFVKMTLATLAGLFLFGVVAFFLMIGFIGAAAALGEKQPVMPKEAVLKIDIRRADPGGRPVCISHRRSDSRSSRNPERCKCNQCCSKGPGSKVHLPQA